MSVMTRKESFGKAFNRSQALFSINADHGLLPYISEYGLNPPVEDEAWDIITLEQRTDYADLTLLIPDKSSLIR